MFESFAAWILNTYIGDYFGNVNTDQLRMSLKTGEIELERLPLKRDLIKHLGLPLEAKTGYIGKISIKFPRWHLFTSEPLVITIENLFLVVKPINNFTYNEEEENRAQQEFKISQLDTMESRWKALHESLTEQSSYYSSSYSSWLNFGSSFINNVLLNIHLKISSIHIRYEDSSTIQGCPFATGIIIRSLSICSTDEKWEPKFVTRDNLSDSDLLFKRIEVESFSCYCDTDITLISNLHFDQMVDLMKDSLEKNLNRKGSFVEHGYIIAPVNGKCCLKRNCSEMSLKSCKKPRTVIDVQLEQVPIMMTAIQYKHLLDWSLAFNTSKTLWKYRKWRPMISKGSRRRLKSYISKSENEDFGYGEQEDEMYLNDNDCDNDYEGIRYGFQPKIWWHFAVNANLEEYRQRRQRFNWHFILQRARDIVSYHRAYLHYLVYNEFFTKEMRYVKDRIENEFTLDEICSIREIVFTECDRLLKQQYNSSSNVSPIDSPNSVIQNFSDTNQSSQTKEQSQQTSTWFLPYVFSNLYYNYTTTYSSTESSSDQSPSDEHSAVNSDKNDLPEEQIQEQNNSNKNRRSHHRRSASSSSISTDDVFLTRDAVFCQFNFEIHNSSFQLIAFNNETLVGNAAQTTIQDQSFVSNADNSFQQKESSGNLLLEFEFTQMKIGVDVTNPNAYSCVCHMNQAYKRRHINSTVQNNLLNNQKFLTQNELNTLQLNLNFECHNMNLTLLRTEHAIISDDNAQKLATAQLTGCGIMFVFSSTLIGIDGKMDSLEILDLVTHPNVNKHKRVLSIGRKQLAPTEDIHEVNETETFDTNISSKRVLEQALSFSLSRHLNENILRLHVEMASFCYVHSSILVYELSLCRKCFSDVLEAYFSRSFKERVKAATTEMFRGIVKKTADVSVDSSADGSFNVSVNSNASLDKTNNGSPISNLSSSNASAKSNFLAGKISKRKFSSRNKASSPFVDNFKLNVFIRSPVIIFPISPSSFEVVVFHLGHMLLNNHKHSSALFSNKANSSGHNRNISKKLSPLSINGYSVHSQYYNNSYNAEIRDLSVYSLDCNKNIERFSQNSNEVIPMEDLYFCDTFGVPILQKTVIEIVLEKKFFPLIEVHASRENSKMSHASKDHLINGLNLISSVNSIDSLVPPKKFSIRSHLYPELTSMCIGSIGGNSNAKLELVLSVEISSIDVRFSYTDLLVFWHILSTLSPANTISASGDITVVGDRCENNNQQEVDKENPSKLLQDKFYSLEKGLNYDDLTSINQDVDPDEFRMCLNNLCDLGFDYRDCLRALTMTNGNVIEAAYLLSSHNANEGGIKNGELQSSNANEVLSDNLFNSSDDNHSQCTSTSTEQSLISRSNDDDSKENKARHRSKKNRLSKTNSSPLLSLFSVIEIRISNGSIRVIDDCNKLDMPLLELGIFDFRLIQYHKSPTTEAHAQTNFYCDYYNSHLSGWEPVIEHCQVAFSWKIHEPRCHLKSMVNTNLASSNGPPPIARKKLAIKVDIKKMFNLNISRALLDLIDKVRTTWVQDIVNFVNLPPEKRSFRQRQPFIPFALKNETGSNITLIVSNKMFSTGKAPDLVTHCDLAQTLKVSFNQVVYFDLVDEKDNLNATNRKCLPFQSLKQNCSSRNANSSLTPLKILVKVDGWNATFPVSIEREGTFIRQVVSERYYNQTAILVFEIALQPSAVKLITVRSSLLVTNQTTKTVELKFANTALSDVKTSYLINPKATFPVPLDLLYARIQLRPCDLGIGTCSSSINWNHVRKYGETFSSLQICTPITHTSQASYSKSTAYVVAVMVERNSIGALIESRNILNSLSSSNNGISSSTSSLVAYNHSHLLTLPSHTITLLPPLQLANRLPYELRFSILQTNSAGTINSGEDYSVHYISPLEPFSIEFTMDHFPKCKALIIQPGAIKNYTTYIDMYDIKGRLLTLYAQVTIVSGSQQPCNAMTITVYAPFWIINRSGLPLVFKQEDCSVEAAGQSEEHERARSISPLLFSFSDSEAPKCCIMRLGRMSPNIEPRWCNFFYLEKDTFYRRLRFTEYQSDQNVSMEKIYEFGIDIRNGRDRYSNTKIVTVAPRFQIENLSSYKLEFAQKYSLDQLSSNNANSHLRSSSFLVENGFMPAYSSSPSKYRTSSFSSNTSTVDPKYSSQIVSALPKSNMPFHWPNSDKPKLLCVRIASIAGCSWSGCFDIGTEQSASFHLNIRDESKRSYFVRVEILLQNATYFIVFTDANSLPPPIRIENFAKVAVEFFQVGSNLRTHVQPNTSIPYALDEPTKPSHITVCAPGGSLSTYDLNSVAPGDSLTYDNFYYISFKNTFKSTNDSFTANYLADLDEEEQFMLMMLTGSDFSNIDSSSSQMLVLDVPDDPIDGDELKSVVLGRKERAKRSQLWRIDIKNRIIHEGSSPPVEPGVQDLGFAEVKFGQSSHPIENCLMVLDVDDSNFRSKSTNLPLVIRKYDPSRYDTQTWKFTSDGRLRCSKYDNLFVQPMEIKDAESNTFTSEFKEDFQFRSGVPAVLSKGPFEKIETASEDINNIPKEQAIEKQKMRRGSGVLNVFVLADGPSRVLRIKDNQESSQGTHINMVNHYPYGPSISNNPSNSFFDRFLRKIELELNLNVDSIGISIISKTNEEIVYIFLQRIIMETMCNPAECHFICIVLDLQVDNQLREFEKEVVLYVSNLDHAINQSETGSAIQALQSSQSHMKPKNPAITFNAHMLFIPNVETNVFKSLQVSSNDLVLNIEELVLLKLLEFINYDPVDNEMNEISSSGGNAELFYHANRNITSYLSRNVQYYFAYLLVRLSRVKLSVFTSAQHITKYLSQLKKKAGIKLIRFEDALIQLKPFHKVYSLMTRRFLQDSIKEHYRSELRSQAAKILGTVDFLGNPVGFLNNLADGFNELIHEGSLSGLFLNVTHGISDSTAKVTSVLSESLGSVTMDTRYQEIRRKIKQQSALGGQRSHLSAGALGLAHGIFGGITSVITQTYDGVVNHGGITGLLSGFGKGVLGTFTKPAVGMLDFASGAATAVRDSSRKASSSTTSGVKRIRLPRTLTIDGRLTTYDPTQATWQARFYNTNDFGSREYGEQFVHVFILADRHFTLLTTERLYFFHSTLNKRDLRDLADNGEQMNYEENATKQQSLSSMATCSIMQLQILPLENFSECIHYQMRQQDAQDFIDRNGARQTCLDLKSLHLLSLDGPDSVLCDFIEFRTGVSSPRSSRSSRVSPIYPQSYSSSNRSSVNEGGVDTIPTVTNIEYPKNLSLCYVYCDNTSTVTRLVQLVNEAKHLQEERKFEVSSINTKR